MTDSNLLADDELGSNLLPEKPRKAGHKNAVQAKAVTQERRTKIILEDNEQIGPTGQFFSADGKAYMLRPGEEASVPESILNILDTAITSVPVVDTSSTVIGYRDRLRFPYRIVADRRTA